MLSKARKNSLELTSANSLILGADNGVRMETCDLNVNMLAVPDSEAGGAPHGSSFLRWFTGKKCSFLGWFRFVLGSLFREKGRFHWEI